MFCVRYKFGTCSRPDALALCYISFATYALLHIVLIELWQYKFWNQINDELSSLRDDSVSSSSSYKLNLKHSKNKVQESVQRLRSEFAITKSKKLRKRLKQKQKQKQKPTAASDETDAHTTSTTNTNTNTNGDDLNAIHNKNGNHSYQTNLSIGSVSPTIESNTQSQTTTLQFAFAFEASELSNDDLFSESIADYSTDNYVNATDIDTDIEQSDSSTNLTAAIGANTPSTASFSGAARKRNIRIILKLLQSMPWFSMPFADGMNQFANDSFKYRYAIYLFNKYISSNGYDALNISWMTLNEIELNIAKIYQFVMKYSVLEKNESKIEIENVSVPKFSNANNSRLLRRFDVKDIETIDELIQRLDRVFDCAVCNLHQ